MTIPDAFFTLDKAKAHLRVTHADEDALITAMLDGAVAAIENETRRCLTSRASDVMVDATDLEACACACNSLGHLAWVFHAPLSPASAAVFAITHPPTGDEEVELDGTTAYFLSSHFGTTVLTVKDWGAIGSEGIVGRIAWDANPQLGVPNDLYAAVMLTLGDLYENREANVAGIAFAPNPTVAKLVRPYVIDMHV